MVAEVFWPKDLFNFMLNLDECRTGAEKRQHSVADSDVTARQQRKAH